ncbi:TPA: DNA cytosine methyltransferase [Klebsiella michiganensis]|nr:DNA cytosine methyltransferase [Klebsiella michiganensis]HDV9064106.1 DNA cytosine methyltransferase [Klebsiella michiganensis]HDV9070907.1 DNA cytosine methyltransferase [Klebsiella michiganensis]
MRSCHSDERRNQLPPVLAQHSYLYCPLFAFVLAPYGLSRLSRWLCGVGGAVVAYYNEIDPHAAQHLRNLIDAGHIAPGVVDTRSIEDVTPNDLIGFTQCHFFAGIGGWSLALRRAGWPDSRPAWTASCPCQPFSAAGKGLGFADERHLWPSAHWLVGQRRPVVVFGEQSGSADANDWIDLVQADVEALGYAFGATAFPSASVGAPHQRDRAYWVADANREQCKECLSGCRESDRKEAGWSSVELAGHCMSCWLAHANDHRQQSGCGAGGGDQCTKAGNNPGRCCQTGSMADSDSHGRKGRLSGRQDAQREVINGQARCGGADSGASPVNGFWRDADWLYCRDGKWRPVRPGSFPLANGVPARVGRLRAYGNAINIEAAAAFIKSYMAAVDHV